MVSSPDTTTTEDARLDTKAATPLLTGDLSTMSLADIRAAQKTLRKNLSPAIVPQLTKQPAALPKDIKKKKKEEENLR